MANRNQFIMSETERRRRTFSESFKIKKVKEIERKITKISEICKEYEVSSPAVYYWLKKYGTMVKKGIRMVVETESDTRQLAELKRHIAELERIVGQKQILIDFKDKMIEIAEELYQIDIKKKCSGQSSSISGSTASYSPSN